MAMTQRERYLAIGVGVIAGIFGVQYAFNSLRAKLDAKYRQIEVAEKKQTDIMRELNDGFIAKKRLRALAEKSLPNKIEAANAQYSDWLTTISRESGLEGITVARQGRPKPNGAYTAYDFSLKADCNTEQALDFLAKFYDRDLLHSIQSFKMIPSRDKRDQFTLQVQARALSLAAAAENQKPSMQSSGRLAMTADEYKQAVLDRNPFSPPNGAPKLETRELKLTLGKSADEELKTKDEEGHGVQLKLVSTELPPGLRMRGNRLTGRPEEAGRWSLEFEAVDDGWPNMSSQGKVAVVVEEPPPPEVKVEPKGFDPATQAYLSAIVTGGRGPQAWVQSRTESNKLYKLNVGEELKIGTIQAKVISINPSEEFVQFESDGARWICDMGNKSLAKSYEESMKDD
ncbi:MAG: hypothetical protein KDB22_04975 [Planctomycetales bacterium]|nr:hypothetical protein [Planctomycetales bacterium]